MDTRQREILDRLYDGSTPEAIPWHFEEPPGPLRQRVEDGSFTACRAIDLGCGLGSASLYLAGQGFDVTGVDASPAAIARAGERAQAANLPVRFVAADLLGPLDGIEPGFGLGFDWEVLHHILPPDRAAYLDNVERLLTPGGHYLSASFSAQDPWLAEQGSQRETPLGTILYFSTEDELRALYQPRFEVLSLDTVEIRGKQAPHKANLALLRKPLSEESES